MPLPRLTATRYVLPLREGGSLPAICDTDAGTEYVVKFRGAGQGPKVLVAEVITANLARAAGLPVPGIAVIELGEGFGMGEPNPEIQDLLRGSVGLNFGLEYLPGAIGFDAAADLRSVDPDLAAAIVWFDALISNVDRTVRNPNLLLWQEKLWIIDHGASLYFHHAEQDWLPRANDRFAMIANHILMPSASSIADAHLRLRPLLTSEVIEAAVADVPQEWLGDEPETTFRRYVEYLTARLDAPGWLEEAESARGRH
jgi:hypothetical protein